VYATRALPVHGQIGNPYGYLVWRLTSDGRKQLAKARRKREDLELPESPQHRVWRDAQATAARRFNGLREQLRRSVSDAATLLEDGGPSDAYFRLRFRIGPAARAVGAVVYCLNEWPEPDDARADVDHDPEYSHYRRNVQEGESEEQCGQRTG
jgi:hypothetical protein